MNLQRHQVARQFSRSSVDYDSVAQMQREMADRLLQFLPTDAQGTLVDLGCGTGNTLAALANRQEIKLIGIDLAPGMISQAAAKLTGHPNVTLQVADLESTPLPDAAANFVFSNAVLQWCDPDRSSREIRRLLSPGGRLMFSTFGPDTLKEIRQAWQSIGDDYQPVHQFESEASWKMRLTRLGIVPVHVQRRFYTSYHQSAIELLTSIKRLGATNAQSNRRPGLLSKQKFQRFCQSLTELADTRTGIPHIPLTFEQLFFVADLRDFKD